MEVLFLLKGLAIGFSIAAPVGPIGILCIRRTLVHGMPIGLVSGLGAASADAIYGVIAAFGLTLIANFLLEQQLWLRVIGGLFLCYLAVSTFKAPIADGVAPDGEQHLVQAYVSTFLLTISNPMTIISFIAVFAGLGFGPQQDFYSAALLVLGVFSGSALWWFILSKTVDALRTKFDSRVLGWVNKAAGMVLGLFGLGALLSVF